MTWPQIEKLVKEQQLEKAAKAVDERLAAAKKEGNEEEWTRALTTRTQLRTALHGHETAVRELREEPWPKGQHARVVLALQYTRALQEYALAYSWEILRRERTVSDGKLELKQWTMDQLAAEAQRALEEPWSARAQLGSKPLSQIASYLQQNNYPKGIRDTLRDLVSYQRVELTSNSAMWRPEHSAGVFELELPALLADGYAKSPLKLDDPAVHPLKKIAWILDDLEAWHRSEGRAEAALEARLTRARELFTHFTRADDRREIAADLAKRLPAARKLPWFAQGKATLAELLRDLGELARARDEAVEGRRTFPDSPGGKRCYYVEKALTAPEYTLAAMTADGPGKRSIELTHKNLGRVYFRAYPQDLEAWLARANDYNLLPANREMQQLIAKGKPIAQWSTELPDTPDLKSHRTYVTLPKLPWGLTVIIASAKEDFSTAHNALYGTNVVVGSLVLLHSRTERGDLAVRVVDGESGRPIEGATVSLNKFDYGKGHTHLKDSKSNAQGEVVFQPPAGSGGGSYFLTAKRGDEVAIDVAGVNLYRKPEPTAGSAALLFTDRSIYRPGQTILWKLIAFEGKPQKGAYKVLPEATVNVELLDANGEVVDRLSLKANQFGSASGSFTVPLGRKLGSWALRASPQGQLSLQVEEYKRPTFEVSFKETAEALRLNRPATLRGEAKYYFGLPVTSGSVKWSVVRTPQYPWWWWGERETADSVAAGKATLGADGGFALTFTPKADEREKELTYRYEVTAEVTDEGGETRSATKATRVGMAAVEVPIESELGFFSAKKAPSFSLRRTNLDGEGRSGKGTWKLVELQQPQKVVLPADETAPKPADANVWTPGDAQYPRWRQLPAFEQTLRTWADGKEIASGALQHGGDGKAELRLEALAPGAYRLRYETVDEFGSRYQTAREFLVVDPKTAIAAPLVLLTEKPTARVGEKARFYANTGLADQPVLVEVFHNDRRVHRQVIQSSVDSLIVELPVDSAARGGFTVTASTVRDFQRLSASVQLFVPWDDKELKVELETFRDRMRPGSHERWRVKTQGAQKQKAELLAYMYDRALDAFALHAPQQIAALYPRRQQAPGLRSNLAWATGHWLRSEGLVVLPEYPPLIGDSLKSIGGVGVGGLGRGGGFDRYGSRMKMSAMVSSEAAEGDLPRSAPAREAPQLSPSRGTMPPTPKAAPELRQDFSETGFWAPHLVTDEEGTAALEFTVPDSVTSWSVWVHGFTKDLLGGSINRTARSVKELMVRPYVPRFLREGDEAELEIVVNNASDAKLSGQVQVEVIDSDSKLSVLRDFGIAQSSFPFSADAGKSASLSVRLRAPARVGQVSFKVTATAGNFSDGELRPVPLLPSRVHLAQSRFVTLKDDEKRELAFPEMLQKDPTRINEQLVVTLDAQLFGSVLHALPYLANYPYECTEQTLNRFLSAGIVSSVFGRYPSIARMAENMGRDTPLEPLDRNDPNRKLALEETPWLLEATGGKQGQPEDWINVLNPRVANAERAAALRKLEDAQTSIGGFPWFPGGPPSPYMTLYVLHGLARGVEFHLEVPRGMVERAWRYVALHFREAYAGKLGKGYRGEFPTFINYVASSFPEEWTEGALTAEERRAILEHSFKHRKELSPYLKAQLALTLQRMGRPDDAKRVFEVVMDSAKTERDLGTYWAPEDRSWLWYNDTIESHAFALRALTELSPKDPRRAGLVQWLLLNKKLNHWKSTRATAEVIYALVKYLDQERALGVPEKTTISLGSRRQTFEFKPDEYSGKANRVIVRGDELESAMSTITVEKQGKGMQFASATWHFSTEQLPKEASGDLLSVSRRYFKRERRGNEAVLLPLKEETKLAVGDEVEVQLSIRARHEVEYVHLRDPRGAGLEPEGARSRYRWDFGLGWFEEPRDSGTNFFFERLPAGEYTLKYRVRVNMAGKFRIGPATLQSMYAPEFTAYSQGQRLMISP